MARHKICSGSHECSSSSGAFCHGGQGQPSLRNVVFGICFGDEASQHKDVEDVCR
jgi:hypothetical protein